MSARVISLDEHRPDQPDALEQAWDAHVRAFTAAVERPSVLTMRAAVAAYDRWLTLFLADEEASGGSG